ncbi:MucR family transcriptional regulator [Methylobacterium sp. E-046]|uniref:MucR family transcriptional regulator n=1 Tax=Methylobacterium sp. E-046 TaxID=2836576 RepID=UPI001FB8F999|nr:MucR family transcriptional regulator [Methylobacterium sp. E-046]MCJ2102425.1 MucR family transcriptional regulator [Methylobacterium sp. E-046]
MTENSPRQVTNFTDLACAIVAAYVSNNPIPAAELPSLIGSVHSAVSGLTSGGASASTGTAKEVEKPSAAQIRKSIRPDGIISFVDGKSYQTLKRHLTKHGLDPQSYRERYGLPSDYPMVAPSYAERRSALAKAIGLGRPGGRVEAKTRGRRKAA